MIVLVESREKTFKFTNQIDPSDESYYTITIKVDEKMYISGQTYYDIIFDYKFEGLESSKQFIHPLYMEKDPNSVVIYKNKMTQIMVDYLLSDPDDLVKVTDTSNVQHYRTLIMLNLKRICN